MAIPLPVSTFVRTKESKYWKWKASSCVPSLSGNYSKLYGRTNLIIPYTRQVRAWNEFAILVPLFHYVPSNFGTMESFVWITPGKVHAKSKQRGGYTASRRVGTIHCCVTVSFNVLLAQRLSFDVLPTQRAHPWECISDGFVLPRDNQSPTDTQYVSLCHQHRFVVLERSLSWTR